MTMKPIVPADLAAFIIVPSNVLGLNTLREQVTRSIRERQQQP